MNNLFSWLLKRFMTAFAVLIAVQLVTYILGLNMILSGYEKNMLNQYEQVAEQVLTESGEALPAVLPGNGPFFVFSVDRTLVFSNKGKGKSITDAELKPVYSNNQLIGYFHAGEAGFTDNNTNRVFLVSIIILSGLAVILSLVIGFLSALFSSRKIAGPINILRNDIHNIRLLKPADDRQFEISELTEISRDVSEAGRTLMSQEEYKRQWLRDLAHDLRTPLSGLKSQLEAMIDGVLEPSPERFGRHLLEIERLENLVASISQLTAVEMQDNLERSEIDVKKFTAQLIAPYEIELKQKSIKLDAEINISSFHADEQLLLRALGNILSNAVKYIDDGDFVQIRFSLIEAEEDSQNHQLKIEIANNGPDIPEQQRELIFTRLFRGDSGRTSPGSGLGLSITREIVKLHDGELRVEDLTADGVKIRGVNFVVTLPEQ